MLPRPSSSGMIWALISSERGMGMSTGKAKNLGVIGFPIAHSLSPVMQNAALRQAGLAYSYIAMPVSPGDLPTAVAGLKSLGFRGFNVTIPHKTAILPLLDAIDEDARMIGAVNTVVCEDGRLVGHNTDATGFIGALRERSFSAAGKRVVILGAGGAARAALWGLIKEKAAAVALGVRNVRKAQDLVRSFRPFLSVVAFDWQEASFRQALSEAELLVNATPLGMSPAVEGCPPVDWSALPAGTLVYDIIYTPKETYLLREAARRGHPVLNGAMMLVGQGAAAFRYWTGQVADQGVMLSALRQSLGY